MDLVALLSSCHAGKGVDLMQLCRLYIPSLLALLAHPSFVTPWQPCGIWVAYTHRPLPCGPAAVVAVEWLPTLARLVAVVLIRPLCLSRDSTSSSASYDVRRCHSGVAGPWQTHASLVKKALNSSSRLLIGSWSLLLLPLGTVPLILCGRSSHQQIKQQQKLPVFLEDFKKLQFLILKKFNSNLKKKITKHSLPTHDLRKTAALDLT